jgi:hypothetical protein
MQSELKAQRGFQSTEKLEIIFGHPFNDQPKLLNFRDHTPKRFDRGAFEVLVHRAACVKALKQPTAYPLITKPIFA